MKAAPSLHLERDVSAYTVAGQRVPSVTEILALAGIVDFGGVPEEMLRKAADRGRAAHRVTAQLDSAETGMVSLYDAEPGAPIVVPLELIGYVDAWRKFRLDTGFSPDLIEHAVVNNEHRYAGTLDRFGAIADKSPWLIDLKTSATVPRWVGLQLAGYELALRPTLNFVQVARVKRAAVRLKTDGNYTLHPFTDRGDYADFLACARVAHWKLLHGGYQV